MNTPLSQNSKSKLAVASLIFVIIAYLVLPLPILLSFSGLLTHGWTATIFLFLLIIGFGLDILSFIFSIVALVFIRKYNLLGKKVAGVCLISSILFPVLFFLLASHQYNFLFVNLGGD